MRNNIIVLAALIYIGLAPVYAQGSAPDGTKKTFTVVIDPGHGGKDPGALGKISREKDLALLISKKTGDYISSLMNDVEVFYTRTTDEYIDLYRRADFAKEKKADLFLSIHVNGNNNSSVFGSETYVMGPSKSERNLDLAIKENSVIMFEENRDQYEGFDPKDPGDYIKFSLFQNTFINQSLLMASQVQDQLRIRANRKDGGVRQGPFLVLWRTTMPSVLVEAGYISNAEEEKYLNSEYGQDIIASAIYRAFKNYKEETEARTAMEKRDLLAENTEDNTLQEEVAEVKNTTEAVEAEKPSIKESGPNVTYRVQVIASREKILPGSHHFKGEKGFDEFHVGEYFKYMTKPIDSYSQSQEIRKRLNTKFPGAFIIAYLDGNRITIQEAMSLDKEK